MKNGRNITASVTFQVYALPEVSCPADIFVTLSEEAFRLSAANPAGGTYSGKGVTAGQEGGFFFNPAVAGLGSHQITYTYTNFGTMCSKACSFTIHVNVVPQNRLLQNLTITGQTDTCFAALQYITLAGNGTHFTVETGAMATFEAGISIFIKDGTHIKSGSYGHFLIKADDYCVNTRSLLIAEYSEPQADHIPQYHDPVSFKVFPNPTQGEFTPEFENQSERTRLLLKYST